MKTKILTMALLAVLPIFLAAQSFESIFKNSAWLAEHLEDENLIIFHVETKDNYDSAHIPGAQFIRMREFSTSTIDSIYSELPTTVYLDSLLRARGVSNDSKVILYYGGQRFAYTYRLYFTLDYLGLAENVFILDGGLKTWNKNELPISTDTVIVTAAEPGSLTIKANPSLIVNKEQVRSFISETDIKIIDARRDGFYSGEEDGKGSYKRPGHIAGAKNITWLDIIDDNQKLKPKEELQQYFIGQGINKEDKVITYCHIGLRASVLYTISKALGHSTKLYDGSINEWDRLDDSYPVENTYK